MKIFSPASVGLFIYINLENWYAPYIILAVSISKQNNYQRFPNPA